MLRRGIEAIDGVTVLVEIMNILLQHKLVCMFYWVRRLEINVISCNMKISQVAQNV